MQWTGKLIGGALGMLLGPWGAVAGFAFGHQFDTNASRRQLPASGDQFFISTFRLMGHVAKADGRVTEREIAAARGVMRALRLNDMQVQVAIAQFTQGKQSQFELAHEMAQLRAACHSQPALLRVFVEIQLRFVLAGGDMTPAARTRVTEAAGLLGISPALLARLEAALRGQSGHDVAQDRPARIAAAYRALEIDSTVSNEELTKAYRRLMSRHHPDKLKANGLPDSMLEHAKQRTQVVREAYEFLREQRRFS